MTAPRTILVRAPNWLGDCVMSLPALDALRAALPDAALDVACRDPLRACFAAHPAVRDVLEAPARSGPWRLWASGRAVRRRMRYDAGLLFTNSFSTAFWMWSAGPLRRVGTRREGRGVFLTEAVPLRRELDAAHMTDFYLHLAARLGADPGPGIPPPGAGPDPVVPGLRVPVAGREEADRLREALAVDRSYAVFAPASAYGPVKDWPSERYADLAARMVAAWRLDVLVTGTPDQQEVCAAVAASGGDGVKNAAGAGGLAGFFGLLDQAELFVGGDSGGAHAAAALDVPTLVLFGLTEPGRTRSLGKRVRMLGTGGATRPDLDDPRFRERAREALAALDTDRVWQAVTELRATNEAVRP